MRTLAHILLAGGLTLAAIALYMVYFQTNRVIASDDCGPADSDMDSSRTPSIQAAGGRGGSDSSPPAPDVPDDLGRRSLLIPVEGISRADLFDTFSDRRGQVRDHEAIDIMAPHGTPVYASEDGRIEKLFWSERGGHTIYHFGPKQLYCHYYAHLDRYAAGLDEGDYVLQGDLIGYVGSSGNASADAPHLHYAIFRLGEDKEWWKGEPLNPFLILTAGGEAER